MRAPLVAAILLPFTLAALGAPARAQDPRPDLEEFVTVSVREKVLSNGDTVEPNEEVRIDVDEARLMEALALHDGVRLAESEARKLERLPEIVPQCMKIEAAWMAFLRDAELGGRIENSAEFQTWTTRALEPLTVLDELTSTDPGDEFSIRLNATLLDAQPGYGSTTELVRAELADLRGRLASHLAERRFGFQVRARLSGSGGAGRPVHVDGYDTHGTHDPRSIPRFQTILDEAGRAEVAAAERLKTNIDAVLDGTVRKELEAARTAMREQLGLLRDALRSGRLREELDSLLEELEADPGTATATLLRDLRRVRELVDAWERLTLPSLPSEGNPLLALSTALGSFLDEATSTLATLRTDLGRLPEALDELGGATATRVAQVVRETLTALEEDERVKAVLERWRDFRASFRRTRAMAESVLGLSEMARDLAPDSQLDTHVDLLTAGARSVGDELLVTLEVTRPLRDGEERHTVTRTRITLHLGFRGLHSLVRGGLLFVDARGAVTGDASWEPIPAVGYYLHYRNDGWGALWNDVLDPGFGFSLSVLDFDTEEDLEVGVAAGLTLFQDILWIGYGRNLQAEADYFYVGLNPLALGGLWSGGD